MRLCQFERRVSAAHSQHKAHPADPNRREAYFSPINGTGTGHFVAAYGCKFRSGRRLALPPFHGQGPGAIRDLERWPLPAQLGQARCPMASQRTDRTGGRARSLGVAQPDGRHHVGPGHERGPGYPGHGGLVAPTCRAVGSAAPLVSGLDGGSTPLISTGSKEIGRWISRTSQARRKPDQHGMA